ncbi:NrdH-redoxin [Deinococcus seoulensis]|uniref:NrdH-redoxin n=1 Tax=Deinococcus seoulensis TaxID=1837379 RepID=A0ABQ2RK99_9DEIO|nr:glutaredoxin family protein [Deinococcus seoulensis]GGR43809.1 NrdH-redoxin [Deinococcus seoulensis]
MTRPDGPPRLTLPTLTLYARPGCHLCEQAAAHLAQLEFNVQTVNVDLDPQLRERHGDHVPVLALGERILGRGAFSRARLSTLKLALIREALSG